MLWHFILDFVGRFPSLRRRFAKWLYDRMATRLRDPGWTFMNYGVLPPDGVVPALEPDDERNRLSIQLYHRTVSPVDLAGLSVLEVGSGRGGGASFLARYHRPAHVTGADFSAEAVELARAFHTAVPNLEFAVGDAERLPFPDASFDAVVNVESSHCYGNIEAFLSEVVRVLRPGGSFLFADLRKAEDMAVLERALDAQPGWRRIAREDITGAVVAALEADDARKRQMIEELVRRPRARKPAGEFAGVVGSRIYEMFRTREFLYHRYAYRRT
ncbi:MAG: class I SAM-dependent methyltransferase [Burkholderiales bacterium]